MFEAVRPPNGRGPLDLNPIGKFRRSKAQHIARITGREIASAASLENVVSNPVGRPADLGTNRKSGQIQTDPMIRIANNIVEDQGRLATDRDNHIDTPVIIEIPNGKPPGGVRFFKGWATRGTDVIKPMTIVVKEQKGFPISQGVIDRFD